jgi:hypothetical protein
LAFQIAESEAVGSLPYMDDICPAFYNGEIRFPYIDMARLAHQIALADAVSTFLPDGTHGP